MFYRLGVEIDFFTGRISRAPALARDTGGFPRLMHLTRFDMKNGANSVSPPVRLSDTGPFLSAQLPARFGFSGALCTRKRAESPRGGERNPVATVDGQREIQFAPAVW